MIQKLWLYPPLAIARLGRSEIPCDSFNWGPNDLRPRGTGKTTVVPAETLRIYQDGAVTSYVPDGLEFKDSAGWRRVCPFFELHGEWTQPDETTSSGPITIQVLRQFDMTPNDLKWNVQVANWKAYNHTENADDKIEATVDLNGDVTSPQILKGTSPELAYSNQQHKPLIPMGKYIELGRVQLTKPRDDNDVFRLRFTPAQGWVYGPEDLNDRLTGEAVQMEMYKIAPERRILNPNANWCNFNVDLNINRIGTPDERTTPPGLYPMDKNGISLGIIDDVCDGLISCSIKGTPPAFARVSVGPPKVNPDRRHFTSLADGLKDRVNRDEVSDPNYVENMTLLSLEIQDFMERVRETMDVINVDAQNDRARLENMDTAREGGFSGDSIREAGNMVFPLVQSKDEIAGRPFPLTELARQNHRRFVSLEVFEDMLREKQDIVDKRIREPRRDPVDYYDKKMPLSMRGPDGHPMTITRRQYDTLMAWQKQLRIHVEE